MKLRDLVLHNFRLKIFSFLVAVLIWETIYLSTKRQAANPGPRLPVPTNQVEH
jgi:hypothetical protein